MIGFVDDTSGSTNDFLKPMDAPKQHHIDKAEADTQQWNDVLHLTGAALNQSKCSHHFLTCDFTLIGLPTATE